MFSLSAVRRTDTIFPADHISLTIFWTRSTSMRMLSIAVLFAFGSVAAAEDTKPEGTWGNKADGFDIKVTFKKGDMLTFVMDNGNDKMELEAKCTFEKENVIK